MRICYDESALSALIRYRNHQGEFLASLDGAELSAIDQQLNLYCQKPPVRLHLGAPENPEGGNYLLELLHPSDAALRSLKPWIDAWQDQKLLKMVDRRTNRTFESRVEKLMLSPETKVELSKFGRFPLQVLTILPS